MRTLPLILVAAGALAAETLPEVPQIACKPGGFAVVRFRSGIEARGKADANFNVAFDNLSYQSNNFDVALRSAMSAWSVVSGSAWRYSFSGHSGIAPTSSDGQMTVTRGGYAFETGVLAVTLVSANAATGQIVDADIFFNPARNFGTTGAPNEIDFESVALHEMGHGLGLDHNDGCYSTRTVMQSAIAAGFLARSLFPPETDGVRYLYPGSGSGGSGPVVTASPAALSFSGTAGGAAPATQSISLSGVAGTAWYAVPTSSGNWLSVSPLNGTAPATATVRATTTGLAAGFYTGRITIVSGASSSDVAVSLSLAAAPSSLQVTPGSLTFSASSDGPSPASQTLSLTGAAGLVWTASTATSWLRLSSSAGTLPGAVTVSVFSAGLAPQVYTGRITVNAGGITRDVAVQLEITTQPRLDVTPAQISVSAPQGSLIPVCTPLRVAIGAAIIDWSARTTEAWLSVVPGSGRTPASPSVCATAGNLQSGAYLGSVTVSASAPNSPLSITVAFTVTSAVDVQDGAIVNAASFSSGQSITAGELVSIFGINLASRTESATSFPLPTDLGDCRVSIGGVTARLIYVSPGQVNLVTPAALADMAGTTTTLTVFNGRFASRAIRVTVARQAPGIFSLLGNGTAAGAITHVDGSLVTRSAPVTGGEIVSVYLTGLGPLAPPFGDGLPAPAEPLAGATGPVRLLVDGQPATIHFAGAAPGFAGLQVVVATLPPVLLRRFPEMAVEVSGVLSNRITAGGPSIASVSPAAVRMGSDAVIAIAGFNLPASSAVTIAGTNVPAAQVGNNPQTLQVVIPAGLLAAPGPLTLTVMDSAALSEPASNPLTLMVER